MSTSGCLIRKMPAETAKMARNQRHPMRSRLMRRASSAGPVLDRQPWNRGEITVRSDHGAVAERQSDGGDLDVNLLHRAADAFQFRENAPEGIGRLFLIGPKDEMSERVVNNLPGCLAACTPFN